MKPRDLQRCIVLALVVCELASTARAQFWAKQPYENWSRRDCDKMLNDSPWARTYTVGRVFIQRAEEPAAVPGREPRPQISYTVRLLSALPVRQAMVRMARLDPNYAKLSPEQKQELDARQQSLIDRSFADRIVFQIDYATNALAYQSELVTRWQGQPEELLKQQVYLIGPRGRIQPARMFVSRDPGGGIQVVFPRVVDGRPVLEAGDKSLSLEFVHPTVGVLTSERVFVQFKVKDLLVKGELFY